MIISTDINIIIIVEVCFHIVYEFISKIYLLIHSFIHKDARFNLGVIFVQLFMVLSSRLFIYLFIYLFINYVSSRNRTYNNIFIYNFCYSHKSS